MKKTALFLIQAKAGLPRIYRCLRNKPHALLSYRKETADTTLYAPNTTWASGRNRLIEYVKANRLLYDWYVFLDEDVVFYEPARSPVALVYCPFWLLRLLQVASGCILHACGKDGSPG